MPYSRTSSDIRRIIRQPRYPTAAGHANRTMAEFRYTDCSSGGPPQSNRSDSDTSSGVCLSIELDYVLNKIKNTFLSQKNLDNETNKGVPKDSVWIQNGSSAWTWWIHNCVLHSCEQTERLVAKPLRVRRTSPDRPCTNLFDSAPMATRKL